MRKTVSRSFSSLIKRTIENSGADHLLAPPSPETPSNELPVVASKDSDESITIFRPEDQSPLLDGTDVSATAAKFRCEYAGCRVIFELASQLVAHCLTMHTHSATGSHGVDATGRKTEQASSLASLIGSAEHGTPQRSFDSLEAPPATSGV